MFRKIVQYSISNRYFIRTVTQTNKKPQQTSNNNNNNTLPEKWDLCAGVLVERLPVVSKTFTAIEKEFQAQLWQIEFEKSLKSNHELKHERDLLQAELFKKGDVEVDLDDSTSKQTAQDLKDAYVDEFKKFQLASRITEADKKNDLKSHNRKLEDILYLFVEQKFGDKNNMALPQGVRRDGETMRQTAERVLKEKCGGQINVQFYGNAPCGFYKYKYPAAVRGEIVGAKVFYYRASLRNGNVDQKIAKIFEWRHKGNLGQNLNNSYAEGIRQFLL